MSFLRGSANYVWCTTSVLGKGATGAVFQVRNLEFQNPGFCETSKSVKFIESGIFTSNLKTKQPKTFHEKKC